MGLPTGTFTHPASGRLQVVFSGQWRVDDADWTGGDWDIVLRCFVGSGADRRTATISLLNPTATLEVAYTGGAELPVGMEYVAHSLESEGSVAARNLSIACHLLPPVVRPRVLRFDDLLQQLKEQLRPMAATPQTPRWLPDTTGAQWFVRPLAAMATVEATGARFTSEDPDAPGTTWLNHPLFDDRDGNPIDPASVVVIGYPNKTLSGEGTPMQTSVLTEVVDGVTRYYIQARGGPGFTDPVDGLFKGTCTLTWRYADMAVLDGATYATARPGLLAAPQESMAPGDTLWICGRHENQTLDWHVSGAPGAYIKLRLDYPSDPGEIIRAPLITTPWEAVGSEWRTDAPAITQATMIEDGVRLTGMHFMSRNRLQVTAINPDLDTISFASIRPITTGTPIEIGSDFVVEEALPVGLTANTRYYAIWVSGTMTFLSVTATQYTVKLAATLEDALAGIAVDIETGLGTRNMFVSVFDVGYPFFDPRPGSLQPGQYVVDPVEQKLYYRPTSGVPGDHELRLHNSTFNGTGACILGNGVSYIKVLGGGEYGGLFGSPPVGRCVMSNQNPIEFLNGSDIVVDGVEIGACRSGVKFDGVERGTVRNCRIKDLAWHACGGEGVTTEEPHMLLERNWISDVGLKHEFGDAQGTVTNPGSHHTIMRRNFVERLGRNSRVNSPSCAVYDSADDTFVYLNWWDDFAGRAVELMAGNEGTTARAVIAANVCTRANARFERADNEIQRNGFIISSIVGALDPGVPDARVFGNLIAWSRVGDQVPGTGDTSGLIYLRRANTTQPATIEAFKRNAVFSVDGPVFSRQFNGTATAPVLVSDRNLYAGLPEFAILVDDGVTVQCWSGGQIQGAAAGTWTADTGNDVHSELAVLTPQDLPRGPTLAELELLRLYDEFDTNDPPTEDLMGAFPFADVAEV